MMPQLLATVAERLSLKRREVCSATGSALADAPLSPCSLNFARAWADVGQLTDSLDDYQKSLALRHRLVRVDPTNAQWRYDEACILDQIGYEYRKAGLIQEAVAVYEVSAAIWRQLAKVDPRNRQLDLAISLGKLGDARLGAADSVGAIAAYEESAVNWRRLLRRDPENAFLRINLAECLENVGDLKFETGDSAGALVAYEHVVATRAQDGVASSLQKISDLERIVKERAAQLALQRELQDIDRLMFEIDQVNAELQEVLSLSPNEGGEMINASRRSLATVEESLIVSRQLAASDPTNARHQYDLSAALEELAQVKVRHGDTIGALSAYEEGLAICRRLADTAQYTEQLQRGLCITLEKVGDLRRAENDHPTAIALYEESLRIRRRLVPQGNGDTDAPDAALSLVATPCTGSKESDVEARRRTTARGQLDLVLTLKKVATTKLHACDYAGALAGLEESLIIARDLLQENRTPYISAALHNLTLSLSKMNALLRLQFARCGKEAFEILDKVSARGWSAQESQRAAKTLGVVVRRLLRQYRKNTSRLLDEVWATAWGAHLEARNDDRQANDKTTIATLSRRGLRIAGEDLEQSPEAAQGSQRAARTVSR
jgi:tetratricopeptide (TPR) repeat protein